MPSSKPAALQALLDARTDLEQGACWAAFLSAYTPVMLRAARSLGGDEDAVMDRYGFVLDMLQQDGCRRLAGYLPTESASFETWLIVVVRRLCLDHHRRRYGRPQAEGEDPQLQRQIRRRLVDLVGEELALDHVPAATPEGHDLERAELTEALADALSALPVEDRLVLRMRFEDDASVPEIARLLGEGSPFRTYRRIDRLLAALRHRLESRGHGPERGDGARPGRKSPRTDPL